jgi:hypothetical protein
MVTRQQQQQSRLSWLEGKTEWNYFVSAALVGNAGNNVACLLG